MTEVCVTLSADDIELIIEWMQEDIDSLIESDSHMDEDGRPIPGTASDATLTLAAQGQLVVNKLRLALDA